MHKRNLDKKTLAGINSLATAAKNQAEMKNIEANM